MTVYILQWHKTIWMVKEMQLWYKGLSYIWATQYCTLWDVLNGSLSYPGLDFYISWQYSLTESKDCSPHCFSPWILITTAGPTLLDLLCLQTEQRHCKRFLISFNLCIHQDIVVWQKHFFLSEYSCQHQIGCKSPVKKIFGRVSSTQEITNKISFLNNIS